MLLTGGVYMQMGMRLPAWRDHRGVTGGCQVLHGDERAGLSLMQENLGLAVIGEVCVESMLLRAGPSTGLDQPPRGYMPTGWAVTATRLIALCRRR